VSWRLLLARAKGGCLVDVQLEANSKTAVVHSYSTICMLCCMNASIHI
jgi:hypothetical protein